LGLIKVKRLSSNSDSNNEFEVLTFLSHQNLSFKIPKPYLLVKIPHYDFVINSKTYEGVYLMLVIEYIEGQNFSFQINPIEHPTCRSDLTNQLNSLHQLGLVFGDVSARNVIKDIDGKYVLIDYGRTFSQENLQSSSNQTLFSTYDIYGDILTQEDDFMDLDNIFEQTKQ